MTSHFGSSIHPSSHHHHRRSSPSPSTLTLLYFTFISLYTPPPLPHPALANLVSRVRLRNSLSLVRFLLYPGLRTRLQNRIYRLVIAANSRIRPARLRLPKASTKRAHFEWKNDRWERVTAPQTTTRTAHKVTTDSMQTSGDAGAGWGSYYRQFTGAADPPEAAAAAAAAAGRASGGRRQKIAGFLKSANELRQSYYQGYSSRSAEIDKELDDFTGDQPTNSWPEVEVMRSGDEELVLFPSYARRRPDKRARNRNASGGNPRGVSRREEDGGGGDAGGREDFLNDEYSSAEEEDDNVVDVDVRGWLFAPHSGPLTRKNRYLHWVALKLCGLPAQALPQPGEPDGNPTAAEAEFTKEATAAIANNGQPLSLYSLEDKLDGLTRASSAAPTPVATVSRRLSWMPSVVSGVGAGPQALPPQQQQQPQLSAADIASAHSALSARLAPFMHRSIPGTPLTIFFFNSRTSQSRTLVSSETGHFALRVALPFFPTHVRVLASETLSATEAVIIHEPTGISLISDIDDTVKHSAVSMGAREIFRNTFTAPLSTLKIPGVAPWYTRLAAPPYNINFHYVSNSPWQLYPVLKSFFEEAGLPPGSMHLKQYSGMLQGIFEPVAERKKGTVERVIKDFPQRRWVLVGDSGEADLEVYTEIVEKFPGRILAVFIRDVTTTSPPPNEKGFFDANESKVDYVNTTAQEAATGIREAETTKAPPAVPPKRRSGNERPEAGAPQESSSSAPPMVPKKTPPPPKPKPAALQGLIRTNTSPATTPTAPSPSPSATSLRGPPPSPPPPPLPRRTTAVLGSAPSDGDALASTSTHPNPPPASPGFPVTPSLATQQQQEVLLSKREELWIRRWERAAGLMARNGVALHSWRNGGDIEAVCRNVVEEALWGR